MKRAAYVMVNHNGGEELCKTCNSVMADLSDDDRLILVDNGSQDNSAKKVLDKYPGIKYFSHEENLQFAEATNIGIRWALKQDFAYIGMINPDVRIVPSMTDLLIEDLETISNLGAVSPVMTFDNPRDKIWFAGGKIFWPFAWISHVGLNKSIDYTDSIKRNSEYLTGCCWLATSNVWDDVGLLDDSYAMYAEDVDWSYRASLKGYKLEVNPKARLIHSLSQSSGGGRSPFKMRYRTLANKLFFHRHTPKYLKPVQFFGSIVTAFLYFGMLLLKGEIEASKEFIKSFIEPLRDPVPWPPNK